jgi:hypothetical protein
MLGRGQCSRLPLFHIIKMDRHELVLTSSAFAEGVRRLTVGRERVRVACGLSRLPDRWEWLVANVVTAPAESPLLVAVRGTHPEVLAEGVRTAAGESGGGRMVLGVGTGPAAGHLCGLVCLDRTLPLHAVRIIGPGLPRFPFATPSPAGLVPGNQERFSRTIGALGKAAFHRMQSLRFAVVGCGRTGSLVAEHVAAHGVAGLTLIDPDVIEPHNLGEMVGDLDGSLGGAKAAAIAERLRRFGLGTEVKAVTASVQSLDALFALKEADVVISCPDNPSARLATAGVAALYLKPILDLGTGILRGPAGREVGLDVRWLPPGRCVSCLGMAREANEPGRLGSLRSLNSWAVGLGFTLLEQFLGGSLAEPLWVQGDVGTDGVPRLARVHVLASRSCRICAQAGRGDDGLNTLGEIISAMSA